MKKMNIRILPNYHVGAYRIRPENICVDKLTHSGVCDTPLHGHFMGTLRIFIMKKMNNCNNPCNLW